MPIACWISKATNTHSQYIILITCPLHECLQEVASVLRRTYIACLVILASHTQWGWMALRLRTFLLEVVICTFLCLILEVGVFFVVGFTHCVVFLFYVRIRVDYYCETHRFVRLYVFVELYAVIWNDVCVVDSLVAHTLRNKCNNNDNLVDCNAVNYNRRSSKWAWVAALYYWIFCCFFFDWTIF